MRHAIKVALAISVIVLAACGGSSNSSKPAPTVTPVSDEAFKAAADQAARSVQIVLGDLPAGWAGEPHTPDDSKLDLSPECAGFNSEDPWTSALVRMFSDDFKDTAGRDLTSEAVAYRSAGLAERESSAGSDLIKRCSDEFGQAIRDDILQGAAPGATADVTLTPLAASELDGWTAGYKISLHVTSATTGKNLSVEGAWAWKVSGRMIAAVQYDTESDLDQTFVRALKSLLAKRLADAEATLPN